MLILDTNVVSELMRGEQSAVVPTFLNASMDKDIRLTSITVYEIWYGIERLNPGRKRDGLDQAFRRFLSFDGLGSLLEFDEEAAYLAASLSVRLERAGRQVDIRDAQIAGIALSRGATLATRNIRHFEGLDLKLVDPWTAAR